MARECPCRSDGFNCNQGRDCPHRTNEPDHFWVLYLLCFVVGVVGCGVVVFG